MATNQPLTDAHHTKGRDIFFVLILRFPKLILGTPNALWALAEWLNVDSIEGLNRNDLHYICSLTNMTHEETLDYVIRTAQRVRAFSSPES